MTPATEGNSTLSRNIIVAFAAIYLIWGTTYLAMRIGLESFLPFVLGAFRFSLAGWLCFVVLRFGGVQNPSWRQWRAAALIGILLMVGGNGFVMLAMHCGLPSGIAAVVVATVPLWMTVIDWLFYRGPTPTLIVVIGLLLGLSGIMLLVDPLQAIGNRSLPIAACGMCLLAPVFWAIGSLQSRKMDLPENVFMSVAVQMIWAGLAFSVISLCTGQINEMNWSSITVRSVAGVLYLIVFGSILALTTYMWLLKRVNASKVATYTYVNPAIAVVLGWLVLGEAITLKMWFAIGLILASVALIVAQKSLTNGRRRDDCRATSGTGKINQRVCTADG